MRLTARRGPAAQKSARLRELVIVDYAFVHSSRDLRRTRGREGVTGTREVSQPIYLGWWSVAHVSTLHALYAPPFSGRNHSTDKD